MCSAACLPLSAEAAELQTSSELSVRPLPPAAFPLGGQQGEWGRSPGPGAQSARPRLLIPSPWLPGCCARPRGPCSGASAQLSALTGSSFAHVPGFHRPTSASYFRLSCFHPLQQLEQCSVSPTCWLSAPPTSLFKLNKPSSFIGPVSPKGGASPMHVPPLPDVLTPLPALAVGCPACSRATGARFQVPLAGASELAASPTPPALGREILRSDPSH